MSSLLVSCIMPTRNRRRFVAQAIEYFARQDYVARELVILDDGEDPVVDLVPPGDAVRYVRLNRRLSLGAARNLACELSHGDLVAHWDDDDWMAPDRLSRQVAALEVAGADVCGAAELLYYRPAAGDAWRHTPNGNGRPRLAGSTLLYRRAAWAEHPFPEKEDADASAFLACFPPERLYSLQDTSFYVGILHGANTSPKRPAGPAWQRRPLHEVALLFSTDFDFYVALRNARSVPAVQPAQLLTALTVGASFMVYDGYGSVAEYLVLGLERAGARVHVVPLGLDPVGLSQEFREILRRSQPAPGSPVLYFAWLRADVERFAATPDLFINTMWEASELPAEWPAWLNRARGVIAPTRFVADVFRRAGVTAPIEVIPEGIDPQVYHWEERAARPGVTTLIVGTHIPRKHTAEGIAAWKEAFAGDPDARLIIKARFRYGNYQSDDPRITYVDENEPTRGIAHWYRQADVLLALGNEGFGLPLVEGMATGLPVVALNSEGQADVCREAPDLVLAVPPASWETYDRPPYGRCGVIGVPGVADVAARLRWVAEHRAEARAMGRAAAGWAAQHRNIWHKAPVVLDLMERTALPSRPLRRSQTIWVPTWGTPCGIAEYTAQLAAYLPDVRVTGRPPDLRGVRLLHVEHHDSLFADAELTRQVLTARAAGSPVCITEHSVHKDSRAWSAKRAPW